MVIIAAAATGFLAMVGRYPAPCAAQTPGTPGPAGETEIVLGLRQTVELVLPGLDRTGPQIARWRLREEQGRLWPSVSLRGRYSFDSSQVVERSDRTIVGSGLSVTRYGADLTVSYNLLQFLASGPRIKGVLAEERASVFRLSQDESDRVLRAVDAYLSLYAEREALNFLDWLRRGQLAFLEQQEAKLAQDGIPMIEMVRARSLVISTDRDDLASKRRAASAELDLRKLTGLRPEQRVLQSFDPEEIDLSLIKTEGLQGLLDLAKDGNPRLVAANLAAEAARWDTRATRTIRYPTLSVSGSYGYGRDQFSNTTSFQSADFRYGFFLSLDLPIFDGGVRKAQIAQSELRAESRSHEARQAAEEVKSQIEDGYWTFVEGERTRELLEQEVLLAEDEWKQASARAEGGATSPGEPLVVLAKLVRLKRDLARVKSDVLLRGVGLILAVGRNPFMPSSPSGDTAGTGQTPAHPTASEPEPEPTPPPGAPSRPIHANGVPSNGVPLALAAPPPPAGEAEATRIPAVEQPPGPRPPAAEPSRAPAGGLATAQAARRVRSLDIVKGERSTTVRIVTDGRVVRYSAIRLGHPSRFVIDLHAVIETDRRLPAGRAADTPELKRVRIGRRPDGVRVVLDLTRGGASSPRIVEREDGLEVILSKGQ